MTRLLACGGAASRHVISLPLTASQRVKDVMLWELSVVEQRYRA
jgi:hypothetical protein